jgi:hypothetical protein
MPYQNISAQLSDRDKADIKAAIATLDEKLPFLVNLTAIERRNLYKMGDKSLGFVNNSVTAALQNQDILPPTFDIPEFERDFALAQDLSEIHAQLQQITEKVDDTLVAVGSEAMRSSLSVYDYVKAAAKHQPGLKALAEQLGERFKALGRRHQDNSQHGSTAEPTS